MARLRYSVAMSLDGFIADEQGGYDWIIAEDGIDFTAFLSNIDTLLMGRGTWQILEGQDDGPAMFAGMKLIVVSTTMDPAAYPDIEVVSTDVVARVEALRRDGEKDIWLFGGGVLFRSMLEAGLVDRVELGIIPVLLGQGIPVLPGLEVPAKLVLHSTEVFDSGIALLKYDVA